MRLPSLTRVRQSAAQQAIRLDEERVSDHRGESQNHLEALYQEHFQLIWRGLRRLGVPPSSVDDATQDVFLVVGRRLSDFGGRSSERTWIYGIAVRVARWYRRQAARSNQTEPFVALADTQAKDPSEAAAEQEAARTLYQVLGHLNDSCREVFVLAELVDMTASEIAAVVGIPENTVYSRLRRARAQFESLLARERARDEWRSG